MKASVSPSMMCADPMRLPSVLADMERGGVEYLHIDIMDGRFVPNFTLGTDFCRALKANTSIPLDLHLMVERPEEKLDWFPIGPGDIVSVHAESTPHICRALENIKEKGAHPFVAINPGTPASVCEPLWELLDGVLVMTVNPGFAGGKLVPSALAKIRTVREMATAAGKPGLAIEADGNVSFENAVRMREMGADIFVAGTSSVFRKDIPFADALNRLRACIA